VPSTRAYLIQASLRCRSVAPAGGTDLLRESLYSWSVSPGMPVVGGEKWRVDVDRRGYDPQVVGMGSTMEGTARSATGESELGDRREKSIADGNDRGCLDRLIEAVAARLTPSGHEGAVSELAHGDSGEEDLVSGHQSDL